MGQEVAKGIVGLQRVPGRGKKQEAEGHVNHKSVSESVQELKPSVGSVGSTARK